MLAMNWRDRVGTRGSDAAAALARLLKDSNRTLERGRNAGMDGARALGQHVIDSAQDARRSTRKLVKGHPFESLLLVGVAGLVGGWLLRYVYERQDAPRRPARARASTARAPRKKTSTTSR